MPRKPTLGLTAWLALLVIGTVVPLLLFAGAALLGISKGSRAARDAGQLDTARALALAVDGEVRSWKAALTALAASRALQQGRLAEFYEEARQVAAQQEGWIVLTDPSYQQVLNTLRPYRSPLPMAGAPETMRAIFQDGKPVVTDVLFGRVAQRFIVAVAVPVLKEGKVIYALSMSFGPERLTHLLRRQQLPASWVAAISDRQRRVVARSVLADTRIGKPVVEWFAAATRAAESGIATGPLIDGRPGQVAFQRLQEVPWVVALAVPMAELPSTTPIFIFLLAGVAVALAAVGLAVYTGRKITVPVARLAAAGEPMLHGKPVDFGVPSGIREVEELQEALKEAAAAVQLHFREREQAAEILQQANEALEARVQDRTAALATANEALQAANAVLQEQIQTREQAEEALRTSEDRYRSLFTGMTEGFALHEIICDAKGEPCDYRFLEINPAFERLTGLNRDAVVGKLMSQALPTEDIAWIRIYGEIALTGKPVHFDNFSRALNRHYEVFAYCPAPRQFAVLFLDITDRKKADEALHRYELLAAHSRDIILFMRREDGRILEANVAAASAYGYTSEELRTLTIQDLRAPDTEGLTAEQMAKADTQGILFETVHRRKDGRVFPVEVSSQGAAVGGLRTLVSVIRDTTEHKRAEAELQSLAKYPAENPHPVLRVARDGILLHANPASQPLLRLWGCRVGQRLPAAWGSRLADAYDAARQEEIEIACEGRVYSLSLVPVAPFGYVNLYGRDSTARKQAEAALQTAKAELEQKVQDRTAELSRTVELLTAEVARRTLAEAALRDRSEQLRLLAAQLTLAEERERQRVATVLHDDLQQLLVGAKLVLAPLAQAAEPSVREAGREVNALLTQCLQSSRSLTEELSPPILHRGGLGSALDWLVRWMAEKHHLLVSVHADETAAPESPDTIVLLFQAIRELLFNAAKHAQVKAAHVEISRQDGQVHVVVSDQGVGFDPTHLRVAGGTAGGFGLFSLRERLELLGGRLEIDSAPGNGSRFTIWLPVHPALPPTQPTDLGTTEPTAPALQPAAPGPAESGIEKIRVLVVDDHVVVRQGLIRLLNEASDIIVVGEAADGETALALTRELLPDVVTMDISLPGIDGVEATRRLHTACPAARVIALSIFDEGTQGATMRAAGAVAYLTKSAPAETLLAAIRASVRTGT